MLLLSTLVRRPLKSMVKKNVGNNYLNSFLITSPLMLHKISVFHFLLIDRIYFFSIWMCSTGSNDFPRSAWLVGKLGRLNAGVQYEPQCKLPTLS